MTARVAVKPEILRWAVNRAKKNEEAVVSKFPRFPRWLDGTERPTIHQLEDFANFTKVPLGTLFLEHPPQETLPVPFYRTIDNRSPESPSAELLDTIRKMTFRQEWMREYLERIDAAPLEFVNAHSAHDPVEAIVKDMRDVLQVKEGWTCVFRSANEALRDFCQRVEEAGVLVVLNSVVGNNTHRGLDPREFRGFVLIDDLAPLVFVNAADSKSAQMFTLAHELAHVFIGQSGIFELANLEPSNNEVELKCNAVAAEFLVPAQHLKIHWNTSTYFMEEIHRLASQYHVSPVVIARRALTLDLISRQMFFDFYDKYSSRFGEEPESVTSRCENC